MGFINGYYFGQIFILQFIALHFHICSLFSLCLFLHFFSVQLYLNPVPHLSADLACTIALTTLSFHIIA